MRGGQGFLKEIAFESNLSTTIDHDCIVKPLAE
jgi:hypothetical protein